MRGDVAVASVSAAAGSRRGSRRSAAAGRWVASPPERAGPVLITAVHCIARLWCSLASRWSGRGDLASRVAGRPRPRRRHGAGCGRAPGGGGDHGRYRYPLTPAGRRDLWRAAGVQTDEVSTTVLTIGLRSTVGDAWLDDRTAAGWETHLSLRDLRRIDPQPPSGGRPTVFVCENPRVLEMALDAGCRAPALCTQGNPPLPSPRCSTDFGRAAPSCTTTAISTGPASPSPTGWSPPTGCTPWRMSTVDYHDGHLARLAPLVGDLPFLGESPVVAAWDNELAPAMAGAPSDSRGARARRPARRHDRGPASGIDALRRSTRPRRQLLRAASRTQLSVPRRRSSRRPRGRAVGVVRVGGGAQAWAVAGLHGEQADPERRERDAAVMVRRHDDRFAARVANSSNRRVAGSTMSTSLHLAPGDHGSFSYGLVARRAEPDDQFGGPVDPTMAAVDRPRDHDVGHPIVVVGGEQSGLVSTPPEPMRLAAPTNTAISSTQALMLVRRAEAPCAAPLPRLRRRRPIPSADVRRAAIPGRRASRPSWVASYR